MHGHLNVKKKYSRYIAIQMCAFLLFFITTNRRKIMRLLVIMKNTYSKNLKNTISYFACRKRRTYLEAV